MQSLNNHLAHVLLEEGLQVLQALNNKVGPHVFHVRHSGYLVTESVHDKHIKDYLYDMLLVAKFYCKSGSWLDRITLCGGRLWVWDYTCLPAEQCHVVVYLDKNGGAILFPTIGGRPPAADKHGICFGLVFNCL